MTLAVATNDPDSVAETYIRQHMRLIRPGATVGIALDCADAPSPRLPIFCLRRPAPGFGRRLGSAVSLLRTGYAAAIPRTEERRLAAFLDDHGVEAVLAEFGTTGAALRHFCRSRDVPLFVNFHGHDATVLGRRRDIRHAYRLLARDAERFICGSRHFAQILERLSIPGHKIEVIPCGIELAGFSGDAEKDPDLVMAVGRLTRKKRPDLAIRAFAQAHARRPALRMEIIGEGSERDACMTAIAELQLEGAVTLLGARPHDEVKRRLASAGIFIQHSVTAENGDQESQGISLLEAMASAVPVAVTDHNGFAETVIHGQTGFLSPEGDLAAMGANILRFAEDHALARAFGRAGRARAAAHFDAAMCAARLRELMFGRSSGRAAPASVVIEAVP